MRVVFEANIFLPRNMNRGVLLNVFASISESPIKMFLVLSLYWAAIAWASFDIHHIQKKNTVAGFKNEVHWVLP